MRIENLKVNEAYISWLDGEEHESQSSQIEAHLQQFVKARKANGAQIRGQLNHIKVGNMVTKAFFCTLATTKKIEHMLMIKLSR